MMFLSYYVFAGNAVRVPHRAARKLVDFLRTLHCFEHSASLNAEPRTYVRASRQKHQRDCTTTTSKVEARPVAKEGGDKISVRNLGAYSTRTTAGSCIGKAYVGTLPPITNSVLGVEQGCSMISVLTSLGLGTATGCGMGDGS